MSLGLAKRKPSDVVFGDDLTITWRDGVVSHFPLFYLRNVCPCANCVDELTGKKVLDSKSINPEVHIKKADYVGNYALRIQWSDGHDAGIYAFKFLRDIFDEAMEKGSDTDGPHAKQV